LTASFALSTQRALAHRANLAAEILLTATSVAAGLATLGIVYDHTAALAGWPPAEATVLLGAFFVVSGLLRAFVEPNLSFFAGKVRDGQFDDLLLLPAPSWFLASLGTCEPLALAESLLGAGTIAAGLARLPRGPSLGGVLAGGALLLAGLAIAWAARVLLASLAFWAPGIEPSVLYGSLWQLGRYPIGIYSPLLRRLLTSLVPVAFITTVPARALTRGADPRTLATALAFALGAVALTRLVWAAGLRRYTSATS